MRTCVDAIVDAVGVRERTCFWSTTACTSSHALLRMMTVRAEKLRTSRARSAIRTGLKPRDVELYGVGDPLA